MIADAVDAETIVGILEAFAFFFGLLVFVTEAERWPGQYIRWTPYTEGANDRYSQASTIRIGIRRKGDRVVLEILSPLDDNFDEQLYAAQAQARERCIQLNAGDRHLRRRLPR